MCCLSVYSTTVVRLVIQRVPLQTRFAHWPLKLSLVDACILRGKLDTAPVHEAASKPNSAW
jgi:hypothetical protein